MVSPCNEKLTLDLHLQNLHLSHHVHCNQHVDNVLGLFKLRKTPTPSPKCPACLTGQHHGSSPNLSQRGSDSGEGKVGLSSR